MNTYLNEKVVPSLKNTNKESLLIQAVRRWRDHTIVVRYLQKLFSYVDMYYTKHHNLPVLKDVGLLCYRNFVYKNIKKEMASSLLDKISAERKGEVIDRSILKDGINLFIEMGQNSLLVYTEDFEKQLLDQTKEFYDLESSKLISEDSCSEYLIKIEVKLKEEEDRARSYLHTSTESSLINTVEKSTITNHAQKLLNMENSGFLVLLQNLDEKKSDLKRMYTLFKRVKELKPMSDLLKDFVKDEGLAIVKNHQEKDDEIDFKAFIDALLDLQEKYSTLVNEQFDKDSNFLEALKDAFTIFVNIDLKDGKGKNISTSELLSTYCDYIMKNTDKIGDENLDSLFDKIVRLFAYITDKDLFQEYYRRQLAKRLLSTSNANHDAERSLIAKLKTLNGAGFTSKLEGMIKDQSTSQDLQNNFKDHAKKDPLPLDFTPTILTTGFWPSFKVDQLSLPQEMEVCIKNFKEFYASRTESRSLKWIHSLGNCTLTALFSSGNKELQVSTYQACILLLFNDYEDGQSRLTPENIQKALNLTTEDVRRNLLSLCLNKQAKILMRISNSEDTKTISPNDEFSVNPDFKSKKHRIKIPNLVLKISGEERKDIDKTMEEDRKYSIEAAIVRIMKARREMKHQDLVVETSKQLLQHFNPDPKSIKSRINDLIGREYIKRDETDPTIYLYIA